MARRHDPCRLVHIQPHVLWWRHDRLAGVQPHPYSGRLLVRPLCPRERLLRLDGRRYALVCTRKGDKEGVSFDIDLVAAMPLKRIPQQPTMQVKSLGITSMAKPLQQPSGPLDIREQHRHRPCRLLRHEADDCAPLAARQGPYICSPFPRLETTSAAEGCDAIDDLRRHQNRVSVKLAAPPIRSPRPIGPLKAVALSAETETLSQSRRAGAAEPRNGEAPPSGGAPRLARDRESPRSAGPSRPFGDHRSSRRARLGSSGPDSASRRTPARS